MSGLESLEHLSVAELREKMKEQGFDVPTSVGREFMMKKLRSIELEAGKSSTQKGRGGNAKRGSVVPRKKSPTPPKTPVGQRDDRTRGGVASSRASSSSGSSHSSVDDVDGSRRSSRQVSSSENRRASSSRLRDDIDCRQSISARETRQQRQSSPCISRSMTRASSGRVTKQEPWSSTRSSRSATRVKTEERGGLSKFEERTIIGDSAASSAQLQEINQFHQAHFSPMTGLNRGSANTNVAQSQVITPVKSNMFGVIVPGRMVSTDFIANQAVNPTKFEFELKEADKVDYLVLFLTGNEPFPLGCGGQIFFGWKNPMNGDAVDDWIKLGFITNEKSSVIYKISDLRNFFLQQAAMQGNPQQVFPFNTARLGIDVQPLEFILKSISPQLEL